MMAGNDCGINTSRIIVRRIPSGTGDEIFVTADGRVWRPYEYGDENITGHVVANRKEFMK